MIYTSLSVPRLFASACALCVTMQGLVVVVVVYCGRCTGAEGVLSKQTDPITLHRFSQFMRCSGWSCGGCNLSMRQGALWYNGILAVAAGMTVTCTAMGMCEWEWNSDALHVQVC